MMHNDFWLSIDVSPRELEMVGASWWPTLKKIFETYTDEEQVLLDFLKIQSINLDNVDQLKKISKSNVAIKLYGLWKYQVNKIPILKEFLHKLKESGFEITNPDKVLPSLIELYTKNLKYLHDSYHYFLWKKIPVLETISPEPKINENLINKFNNSQKKVIRKANKLLNYKSHLGYSFSINNEYFYYYERAKKETVISGYGEKKTLRKKEMYFLKFDKTNNEIEIRTRNPNILGIFIDIFHDFNLKIYGITPKPINCKVGPIVKQILEHKDPNINVIGITFNRLEKNVSCKTELEQLKNQPPLKDSLSILIEEGLIDPSNIRCINSFVLDFNGFPMTIKLDNRSDCVAFKLSKSGLVDSKFNEICKALKLSFDLNVNTKYYELTIDETEKKNILQDIIGKDVTSLTPKEILVYDEINKKGILGSKFDTHFVCSHDRYHRISEGCKDVCPICQNPLIELMPKEKIIIDEKKLLFYLIERLNKIYNKHAVELINLNQEGISKFIRLQTVITDIYLYPYFLGHIKDKIKKWDKELIPSIRILIGKKIPEYDEFELSSTIYLYDLLFYGDDQLKNEIGKLSTLKLDHLTEQQAKKSKDVLNQIISGTEISTIIQDKPKGDAFEETVYPLLRRIFFGIVKWGKSKRFETVPDGALGIKLSSRKSEAFSMIYDFKYSDSSYDIDKRQARDYIQRANQSKEIKDFSKGLSAFLVLAHNVTDTVFKNTAENAYLYKRWKKGKCIMLRSKELIYLYDKFESEFNHNMDFKVAINLAFANYIKTCSERTIIFDNPKIDEVFNKAKEIGDRLDITGLYEHMKKNIVH